LSKNPQSTVEANQFTSYYTHSHQSAYLVFNATFVFNANKKKTTGCLFISYVLPLPMLLRNPRQLLLLLFVKILLQITSSHKLDDNLQNCVELA